MGGGKAKLLCNYTSQCLVGRSGPATSAKPQCVTLCVCGCMWSVKRERLQFPVWDADPLIAPLHPDRSFRKYGEHALSHAQTHAPFLCHTSESRMGNNLATRFSATWLKNNYRDINAVIVQLQINIRIWQMYEKSHIVIIHHHFIHCELNIFEFWTLGLTKQKTFASLIIEKKL